MPPDLDQGGEELLFSSVIIEQARLARSVAKDVVADARRICAAARRAVADAQVSRAAARWSTPKKG
jgi:hypothetical protein